MPSDFPLLKQVFRTVAAIAGINIPDEALSVESFPAPHIPPSLPNGKMTVYVFEWKGQCLKIGKVGAKSNARYTSQHYSASSSNSNLAKSLCSPIAKIELGLLDISESNVGAWIKSNTDRTNFLLDAEYGIPVLNLLESFLQCQLRPRFEGFDTQR